MGPLFKEAMASRELMSELGSSVDVDIIRTTREAFNGRSLMANIWKNEYITGLIQ